MGELLRFEKESEKNKKQQRKLILRELLDQDKAETFIRYMTAVLKSIQNMRRSIFGTAYQDALTLAKKYTNEEIIGWINGWSELEVKKKPLFYRAILDEAISRGIVHK